MAETTLYKAVFLNKLTDSAQEAAETQTWLEFSFHCKYINEETFNRLKILNFYLPGEKKIAGVTFNPGIYLKFD